MKHGFDLNGLLTPGILLRAESAVLLATCVGLYWWHGGSWWLFAVLLFAPDLSAIGYAAGTQVGVISYNLAHAYVVPAIFLIVGAFGQNWAIDVAIIWAAHIALDRAIGYGLKYTEGVKQTHLSRIGLRLAE